MALTDPMTAPQVRLIRDLAAGHVLTAANAERLEAKLTTHERRERVRDRGWANQVISWLRRQPAQASVKVRAAVGVYRRGGETFVVREGREGRTYASRVQEFGGTRLTQAGEKVSFRLAKAPGVVFELRPTDRLTGAAVEAFVARYGKCVCGRDLRAAASVKRGMGPVCYARYAA